MEKINIAELLKDCPKGMELDCLMYEDVYFDFVDELNIIHCYIQHEAHKTSLTFNQHGTPNSDIKSKCIIFPKGKTTWEGFVPPIQPKFKVRDRIKYRSGEIVYRIVKITEDSYVLDNLCSIPISIEHVYNLVPAKFDIATLKPFESRVLARSDDKDRWKPAIFGGCARNRYNEIEYFYALGGTCWRNCIPYEGNEHLLSTTNDCDEFYKNW